MIDPKKYGAETSSDVAAFLVGAFIGGALDAVLNVAGFAEPLVFAPICGAGGLGAKKAIFDVPRHREQQSRQREIERMLWEAGRLRRDGKVNEANELEDKAKQMSFE